MKASSRRLLAIGALVALVALGYRRLNESQRRFLKELVRQVPYLLPRYFV